MLIRFWFGAIHIGRPSHIGTEGDYDASITWCWGRRGYDVPPGELRWRFIWRFAWNWIPDAIYHTEPELLSATQIAFRRTVDAISGHRILVLPEQLRPTDRERVIGFGQWRRSLIILRSTRRSKVHIYLTGQKERETAHHHVYVAPAAYPGVSEAPSEWLNADKTPRTFDVIFVHGRADVEQNLGEFMVKNGLANRTRLIRPAGGLLGGLARTISGR